MKSAPTMSHAEQAGLWWVRLREVDISPEEISQWLDWCQSDPAHLEAFEKIERLGGRLSAMDAEARAALTRELLQPPPAADKAASRRRLRRWLPALATAATLVVGVSVWLYVRDAAPPPLTYTTQRGQQRDVALPDGSQLAIGAMSSVSVRYSDEQRHLGLDSGEAYFEVAPNPQRPFVVQAGGFRVTAVGTAFNIRRTGRQVEVAVIHGTVDLREVDAAAADASSARKLRVEAGQQVVTGDGAGADGWAQSEIDPQQALSWRSGSMAFVNQDLALVVANLNRYAEHTVVLADPALGQLRYTGTVVQGREDDWVSAIEAVFPVRAVRDDQGRVLLSQR